MHLVAACSTAQCVAVGVAVGGVEGDAVCVAVY